MSATCLEAGIDFSSIRRVLLIKWSAMGDVALATALFEDVARAMPQARIDLNTLKPWDTLFRHDPRFAEIVTFDLRGRQNKALQHWLWLRRIHAARYDLVIDLQGTDHSRLLLSLLRWVPGHRPRLAGVHAGYPYDLAPGALPGRRHAWDYGRALLDTLGIAVSAVRPVVHAGPEHRAHAAELLARHRLASGQYGVLLPGCQAGGHLKRWGAERYAALARQIYTTAGLRCLILGAMDEQEECRQIAALAGPAVVDLCGQTALLDLVPLAEGARFIVANDTGTAHLAACSGCAMTVIFGPTDPLRTSPLGAQIVTLQTTGLDCLNCYCRHPCAHHSCMARITPAQVLATLPL